MGKERELISVCVSKWWVKLKWMRTSQSRSGAPKHRNARKIAKSVNYLEHQAKLEEKPALLQCLKLKIVAASLDNRNPVGGQQVCNRTFGHPPALIFLIFGEVRVPNLTSVLKMWPD